MMLLNLLKIWLKSWFLKMILKKLILPRFCQQVGWSTHAPRLAKSTTTMSRRRRRYGINQPPYRHSRQCHRRHCHCRRRRFRLRTLAPRFCQQVGWSTHAPILTKSTTTMSRRRRRYGRNQPPYRHSRHCHRRRHRHSRFHGIGKSTSMLHLGERTIAIESQGMCNGSYLEPTTLGTCHL